VPIHWRSQTDIDEENRYGHVREDRPICRICHREISNDNWRGGPLRGYVCSFCYELQLDDLRHDADLT